jgi:O-methyltransferase domain/Dimerisation domain
MSTAKSDGASMEPAASLMQLATAFRASRAISVATQLGVPDLLASGPQSSEQLASATRTHPSSLGRLMRALCAVGIFREAEPDRFDLAPMGNLLRSDVPGSMRAGVLFLAGDTPWRVWGDLLFSVRTNEAAFDHVLGMQTFDYWATHPEEATIHDQFMADRSAAVAAPVIAAYDFSGFRTIADVGGGTGLLLAEILAAHPKAQGILFDLPNVVADAREVLESRKVLDRCRIEAGSFFESVPTEAECYLLKYIIHDWDDVRASSILANCRKAMQRSSTLLIIDNVLPDRLEQGRSVPGFMTDLEMLLRTPGGRERTEEQFRALLADAGFELKRVIPNASPLSIVEARPQP